MPNANSLAMRLMILTLLFMGLPGTLDAQLERVWEVEVDIPNATFDDLTHGEDGCVGFAIDGRTSSGVLTKTLILISPEGVLITKAPVSHHPVIVTRTHVVARSVGEFLNRIGARPE